MQPVLRFKLSVGCKAAPRLFACERCAPRSSEVYARLALADGDFVILLLPGVRGIPWQCLIMLTCDQSVHIVHQTMSDTLHINAHTVQLRHHKCQAGRSLAIKILVLFLSILSYNQRPP